MRSIVGVCVMLFLGGACGSDDEDEGSQPAPSAQGGGDASGETAACTCSCACCVALDDCGVAETFDADTSQQCEDKCSTRCDGSYSGGSQCSSK